VLAGGSGTRLWPLSRADRPKQLLSLQHGGSLVEVTVLRMLRVVPPERLLVVTGSSLAARIHDAMPYLPPESVVAEPEARDTMAAAVLGAAEVSRRAGREDAPMLVAPCDHAVWGLDAWRLAARSALAWAAATPCLVTIGLQPARPETGYGYILPGELAPAPEALDQACRPAPSAARRLQAFIEKPQSPRAGQMMAAGWLWNSGIFAWQAMTWLDEVRRRVRGANRGVSAVLRGDIRTGYRLLPRQSIDRAVFERGAAALVVEGGFGWEDLGSWGAVWRAGAPDDAGNVVRGPGLIVEGRDNLIWSSGRPVVVAGLQGMLVVADGDVVLVAPRGQDQRIRQVIDYLRRAGWQQCL
jgi:mannose-1-phosphate guanylyltransferase/mannose-6-phosphate isomerase